MRHAGARLERAVASPGRRRGMDFDLAHKHKKEALTCQLSSVARPPAATQGHKWGSAVPRSLDGPICSCFLHSFQEMGVESTPSDMIGIE